MTVGSATGSHGEPMILAISMDSAGATIMAVQVNLTFEGATLFNGVGAAGAAMPHRGFSHPTRQPPAA